MPEGTSLYVRRISSKRHGTPKQFAKKCADHKLGWIAIAGIWQDRVNGRVTDRRMNQLATALRYAEELERKDIPVWIWGYPWQGVEERFVEKMMAYDDGRGRVLLDPELGANPLRSSKGAGKKAANAHAAKLVRVFSETDLRCLGLSTFGSGWKLKWFPLLAFTQALTAHFGGRTFIGGQTYTDDGYIDLSIADMQKCIVKAGGQVIQPGTERGGANGIPERGVEVVPNFGTYTWELNGRRGKRRKGAKAKPKTPAELRAHLYEFINEGEPVDAVIGWAENFLNDKTWDVLAEFADLMQRGACRLPRA